MLIRELNSVRELSSLTFLVIESQNSDFLISLHYSCDNLLD